MPIVNTYVPGVPDLHQTGASFMAVLTQGREGRYKVYTGLVKLPPTDHFLYEEERKAAAVRVAGLGRPVSYQEACCYFPSIQIIEYRP